MICFIRSFTLRSEEKDKREIGTSTLTPSDWAFNCCSVASVGPPTPPAAVSLSVGGMEDVDFRGGIIWFARFVLVGRARFCDIEKGRRSGCFGLIW